MIIETFEFVVLGSVHWKELEAMRAAGWNAELIGGQIVLVRKMTEVSA